MATKLDKAIKRELELDGKTYTVVISPEGIKMTVKGFRKGSETPWRTLLPTGAPRDLGPLTRPRDPVADFPP